MYIITNSSKPLTQRPKDQILKTNAFVAVSLILLTALSVYAAVRLFDHPGRLFRSRFLYGNDLPIFQYQGEINHGFWRAAGHLWGYYPFYMAGYPFVEYTSGLIWGFVFILLSWLPVGVAAAIFVLFIAALNPLTYYVAAGRLEKSPSWQLGGAVLGTASFFGGPGIIFWWLGLVEGALSTLFVALSYAFLMEWSRHGRFFSWVGFTLCGAAALLSHKIGGACLAVLIIVSAPIMGLSFRRWLWLGAACVFMVIANLFWLIPLAMFIGERVEPPSGIWQGPRGGGLLADLFTLYTPAGSLPIVWFLIIMGLLGIRRWWRRERRKALAFLTGMVVLVIIAYWGEHVERLVAMQPRRFLSFVIALLVLPSVMGMRWLWEQAGRKAFIGVMALTIIAAIVTPSSYRRLMAFPLLSEAPPTLMEIAGRISSDVNLARILVEETAGGARGIPPYFGGHFYTLIPLLTGKEVLGGYGQGLSYSSMFLRDGKIMGRPVGTISEDELKNYLDLYNVGVILCFSEAAKSRFDMATPLIEKIADYKLLRWYKVNREGNFLIGATGRVISRMNAIEVHDMRSDRDMVILKYHWAKTLRSDPPLKIERVLIGGDPVGFIGVHNPPPSFTIYHKY